MFELYFDGACEPINPGGTASYGWAIKKDGKDLQVGSGIIGSGDGMTNNVAEYMGLIKGLEEFKKLGLKEKLLIKGDSSMVLNMVSGKWGWNKSRTTWNPHKKMPHLKKLLDQARNLLNDVDYDVMWIPREQNKQADALSKHMTQDT
jgi:ribonuclease HI